MINRGSQKGCGRNPFLSTQKVLLVDILNLGFCISKLSSLLEVTPQPCPPGYESAFLLRSESMDPLHRGEVCRPPCGVPGPLGLLTRKRF